MGNINKKYKRASKHLAFPSVNVELFLKEKGINFTKSGDWLRMRCPFPEHNDRNPSFYIHKKHGGFNCFSRCGTGNWLEFITIMGWVKDVGDIRLLTDSVLPDVIWEDIKDDILFEEVDKEIYVPNNYKQIKIKDKNKYTDYLKSRNILCLLESYKLYCSDDYKYKNSIMIPVHNESGKFIWFEGRYIDKNKRKYYRPKNVKKENVLFNYHRIKDSNSIIIFEGILDAMYMYYLGYPATCIFGWNISNYQLSLIANFDSVIIAFDNDKAGIKGYLKAKEKLVNSGVEIYRMIFPKNKDVVQLGLKSKKIYNRKKLIYS